MPAKLLRTGNRSYTIVRVAPDSVRFPAGDVDMWTPAKLPDVVIRSREARFFIAVGRLREGVTPARRAAQVDPLEALRHPSALPPGRPAGPRRDASSACGVSPRYCAGFPAAIFRKKPAI
jgi:hypothetical protein